MNLTKNPLIPQELNRLRETLSQAPRLVSTSLSSVSPTASASSHAHDSEAGVSPTARVRGGMSFAGCAVPSPIYEIDLEADEEEQSTSTDVIVPLDGVAEERRGQAAASACVSGVSAAIVGSSIEADNVTPGRRPGGRNMFAGTPGSASKGCKLRSTSPRRSPSRQLSSDTAAGIPSEYNITDSAAGSTAGVLNIDVLEMSTLAVAAARAAAHAGLPESVYSPRKSRPTSPAAPFSSNSSESNKSPAALPPISTDGMWSTSGKKAPRPNDGANATTPGAAVKTPSDSESVLPEAERELSESDAVQNGVPWANVLSGFNFGGVMENFSPRADSASESPSFQGQSPSFPPWPPARAISSSPKISSLPVSRLPQIDDDDTDRVNKTDKRKKEDNHLPRATPRPRFGEHVESKSRLVLELEPESEQEQEQEPELEPAPESLSFEKTRAFISRELGKTSWLSPVFEAPEKEAACLYESETESEVSSRASSVSGALTSVRWGFRDPAVLLSLAVAKAGQIAAIPPPSLGSPTKIGKPLPAVEEGSLEADWAVSLPGTPLVSVCVSPTRVRDGGGGGGCNFKNDERSVEPVESLVASTFSSIPSPSRRPKTGDDRVDELAEAIKGGGIKEDDDAPAEKAFPSTRASKGSPFRRTFRVPGGAVPANLASSPANEIIEEWDWPEGMEDSPANASSTGPDEREASSRTVDIKGARGNNGPKLSPRSPARNKEGFARPLVLPSAVSSKFLTLIRQFFFLFGVLSRGVEFP